MAQPNSKRLMNNPMTILCITIAIASEPLKKAALVNDKRNFAPVLKKQLESLFIDCMAGNERIFIEVMNNEELRAIVLENLLSSIYDRLRENDQI